VTDLHDSNQHIWSDISVQMLWSAVGVETVYALYIHWNWCLCSKFIDSFEGENNKKENIRSFKLSLIRSYRIQRIPFHSSRWHFVTKSSMFAGSSSMGSTVDSGWNHHIIVSASSVAAHQVAEWVTEFGVEEKYPVSLQVQRMVTSCLSYCSSYVPIGSGIQVSACYH
jgi:hypothetical protein